MLRSLAYSAWLMAVDGPESIEEILIKVKQVLGAVNRGLLDAWVRVHVRRRFDCRVIVFGRVHREHHFRVIARDDDASLVACHDALYLRVFVAVLPGEYLAQIKVDPLHAAAVK